MPSEPIRLSLRYSDHAKEMALFFEFVLTGFANIAQIFTQALLYRIRIRDFVGAPFMRVIAACLSLFWRSLSESGRAQNYH